jgi:hypothetical protein
MRGKALIGAAFALVVCVAGKPALARGEPEPPADAKHSDPTWRIHVPLTPAARVQPYAAINRDPAEVDRSSVSRRVAGVPDPGRTAMGTGLRWKLAGGAELFGEYDFLSLPSADLAAPRTELEVRPELRGGFSIPF